MSMPERSVSTGGAPRWRVMPCAVWSDTATAWARDERSTKAASRSWSSGMPCSITTCGMRGAAMAGDRGDGDRLREEDVGLEVAHQHPQRPHPRQHRLRRQLHLGQQARLDRRAERVGVPARAAAEGHQHLVPALLQALRVEHGQPLGAAESRASVTGAGRARSHPTGGVAHHAASAGRGRPRSQWSRQSSKTSRHHSWWPGEAAAAGEAPVDAGGPSSGGRARRARSARGRAAAPSARRAATPCAGP